MAEVTLAISVMMSYMAALSTVACLEKMMLLRHFAWAVSEHQRMQSAQVAAALNDEDFPFEDQIAETGRQRERAKCAVIAHREEHG